MCSINQHLSPIEGSEQTSSTGRSVVSLEKRSYAGSFDAQPIKLMHDHPKNRHSSESPQSRQPRPRFCEIFRISKFSLLRLHMDWYKSSYSRPLANDAWGR